MISCPCIVLYLCLQCEPALTSLESDWWASITSNSKIKFPSSEPVNLNPACHNRYHLLHLRLGRSLSVPCASIKVFWLWMDVMQTKQAPAAIKHTVFASGVSNWSVCVCVCVCECGNWLKTVIIANFITKRSGRWESLTVMAENNDRNRKKKPLSLPD